MSQVHVDKIYNRSADGAPQLIYGAEVLVGQGITGSGGINISGVATAGSFTGNVTGDATGLSGSPDVTVNNLIGVAATFSGITTVTSADALFSKQLGVSGIVTAGTCFKTGDGVFGAGIGATITGDGNAVFSGIVTASQFDGAGARWVLGADGTSHYTFTGPGLTGAENDPTLYLTRGEKYHFENTMGSHPFQIQSTYEDTGGTAYTDGITNSGVSNGTLIWDVQFDTPEKLYYQCTAHANMSGVIYIGNSGDGILLDGTLVEAFSSTTTAWSSTADLNISNGNLQFCSANLAGTNNTLNIMSTTGINTDLAIGQALNVTGITSVSAATAYVNALTIDGVATKVWWVGGSTPAAGGSSGFDTYSFNIIKTGDAKFNVIGNQVLTS